MGLLEGYLLGRLINDDLKNKRHNSQTYERVNDTLQSLSIANNQFKTREDLYNRFVYAVFELEILVSKNAEQIPQELLNLYCDSKDIMDYEIDLYNDLRKILVEICKLHNYG